MVLELGFGSCVAGTRTDLTKVHLQVRFDQTRLMELQALGF